MENTLLRENWKQLRGRIQEKWGELTNDDMDRIEGKWDRLVGAIENRYSYAREQAEAEVADFLDKLEESLTAE